MTTVVYADGTLAADRRVTMGSTIVEGDYRKVGHTPDGWLFAWCGTVVDGYAFGEWACGQRNDPPPKGSYNGVLISTEGRVHSFEDGKPLPRPSRTKFHAWGSGADAALGALHAGATPRQAVLIAQKIDSCSGGGVDVVTLKKARRKSSSPSK